MTHVIELLPINATTTGVGKDFGGMSKQFPDMITNGSWAIRRSYLAGNRKLPKFVLDMMNADSFKDGEQGVTMDKLITETCGNLERGKNIEICPAIAAVNKKFDGSPVPLCRFEECGAKFYVLANAYFVQFLQGMFETGLWVSYGKDKPMLLFKDTGKPDIERTLENVIAILMPYQSKSDVSGLTGSMQDWDVETPEPETPKPAKQTKQSKPVEAVKAACAHVRKMFINGGFNCRDCMAMHV